MMAQLQDREADCTFLLGKTGEVFSIIVSVVQMIGSYIHIFYTFVMGITRKSCSIS